MESRGEVGWGAGGERQRLAMGSAPGEPSLGGCGGRGVAPVPSARDLEQQLREAPESHLPRPWPVSPPHISPPSPYLLHTLCRSAACSGLGCK